MWFVNARLCVTADGLVWVCCVALGCVVGVGVVAVLWFVLFGGSLVLGLDVICGLFCVSRVHLLLFFSWLVVLLVVIILDFMLDFS